MTQRPTYDDANLILRLYEMRRDERMRQARAWFTAKCKVKSYDELIKLAPGRLRRVGRTICALRTESYSPPQVKPIAVLSWEAAAVKVTGARTAVAAATNLAFTKFLFVIARADDDAHGARLRTAGGNIARGFFNDFDIDDSREMQSQRFETIQFFVREGEAPAVRNLSGPVHQQGAPHGAGVQQVPAAAAGDRRRAAAPHRRRRGDPHRSTARSAIRATRARRWCNYSNKGAPPRRSGRLSKNAIIMPIRKTAEWWQKSALERHSYFYPHVDHASATPVKGHALAAEKGIPVAVPPRVSQPRRLRAARRVRLRDATSNVTMSRCRCSTR